MRLTDDRYAGEKNQFELAIRMIRHEARTRTIRECTGLSDDRIRKVYATYFRDAGRADVKRRRGKSPRQVQHYVRNPVNQLQATTLVALFCAGLLIRIDDDDKVHPRWPRPDVEYGHRLCRAYETYLVLHENAALSFEWAWNLLQCISYNDELYLAACDGCGARYVQDAYALDGRTCPACVIGATSGTLAGPVADGQKRQ
ncbi:MAG: flagellar transcriptional regulator FlhC [Proteobacteria bacterium]|nr:flagellar transcriptional regulator FlhC [Pseudomonadota bacterium]